MKKAKKAEEEKKKSKTVLLRKTYRRVEPILRHRHTIEKAIYGVMYLVTYWKR